MFLLLLLLSVFLNLVQSKPGDNDKTLLSCIKNAVAIPKVGNPKNTPIPVGSMNPIDDNIPTTIANPVNNLN